MIQRLEPGPGQASVWDYPRPPRLEICDRPIEIVFNGVTIAATQRSQRVLETTHPPVYYIPPEDIQMQYLVPTSRRSFCEWKGVAGYYRLAVGDASGLGKGDRQLDDVAWFYPEPTEAFAALRNHVAFYARPMDRCTVGGERVIPQPGNFYGGWITSDIVGPFKSGPGLYESVVE